MRLWILPYAIRDYQSDVNVRGRVPIRTAYITGSSHGFKVLAIKNSKVLDWLDASPDDKPLFHRNPKLHQALY